METQPFSIEWWLNVMTATLEVLIVVELGLLALVATLPALQLITGLYTKLKMLRSARPPANSATRRTGHSTGIRSRITLVMTELPQKKPGQRPAEAIAQLAFGEGLGDAQTPERSANTSTSNRTTLSGATWVISTWPLGSDEAWARIFKFRMFQ